MSQVGIPKGTRDFSPEVMVKRNYIFNTIKEIFETHSLLPIETPCMENLSVLTGKYGDEGDQLIFKILNSGDYLKKANKEALGESDSKKLAPSICERALRYDLTVPFARYVVQHQNDITLPFKRYQIQPVWRADRPQKGRYREFFQCDADIIGTNNLLAEAELLEIFEEVFTKLKLDNEISIKINNRKILAGIAEVLKIEHKFTSFTVTLDKLDKIGAKKVLEELSKDGIEEMALTKLETLFELSGSNLEKLNSLSSFLEESEVGMKGISELKEIIEKSSELADFDVTLARGLGYYTGAIFEVKVKDGQLGSIGAGGRYDDLTGVFGVKKLSGVGISFGADRVYDLLEMKNLFPQNLTHFVDLFFVNFGEKSNQYLRPVIKELRLQGKRCELYLEETKLKKQMKYANSKHARFVILCGEEEIQKGLFQVKNMETGEQREISKEELFKL